MKKTMHINDIILDQIRFRYKFYNRRIGGIDRKVNSFILSDYVYPTEIANSILSNEPILRLALTNRLAISERVSRDLSIPKINIADLCAMLGYTKTSIAKILNAIKRKKINLILVGAGGSGSNFLHWTYEMMEWIGKSHIFDQVRVYDDDQFDVPNLLRIPFLFDNNQQSTEKVNSLPAKFIFLAKTYRRYPCKMEFDNLNKEAKGYVFYGAPDIRTRELLDNIGAKFYSATHQDNSYKIVYRPRVDDDLILETYGKINLSTFFMNHLKMTINFLTHLGSDDFSAPIEPNTVMTVGNMDAMSQDEGFFKSGSKKIYLPTESQLREITIEREG